MNKKDILAQYDRFVSQLRIEVDQTFWLYNFFFAVHSALLGIVLLGKFQGFHLFIGIIFGLMLSIYWIIIMKIKNKWRESWLERIREIENHEIIKIPEEFQMWPNNIGPKRGLWNILFLLPKGLIIVWTIILLFNFLSCVSL